MKYLIISFLFIPSIAWAISGACSSHGGVNCSIPSSSGKAMCSDGFESSVSFYEVSECTCFPPITTGCTTENDYQAMAMKTVVNGTSRYATDMASGDLQACRSQINDYQAQLITYNNCLAQKDYKPTYTPSSYDQAVQRVTNSCLDWRGQNAYFDASTLKCLCKNGFVSDQYNRCVTPQEFCVSKFGPDSYSDETATNCLCKNGFLIENGCVSYESSCKEHFGSHSTAGNPGYCMCERGFEFTTSTVTNLSYCSPIKVSPILTSATSSTPNVLTISTSTPRFIFTKNLKLGSKNAEVKNLQNLLVHTGFLKIKVTDYFGTFTKQALIKFQKANHLKQTGYLDNATLKFINN